MEWVEHVRNVMTHAQKPDLVFQGNGRVHLNRLEASVQSTTGSRGVRISGSNGGYTTFWGTVQDYWLPNPLACFPFASPPVRHRVPSHFKWTPRSMVYQALLPLMRTSRLPVVDWTDTPRRFKWSRPFRRKTKSRFYACAITFQLASTHSIRQLPLCFPCFASPCAITFQLASTRR